MGDSFADKNLLRHNNFLSRRVRKSQNTVGYIAYSFQHFSPRQDVKLPDHRFVNQIYLLVAGEKTNFSNELLLIDGINALPHDPH